MKRTSQALVLLFLLAVFGGMVSAAAQSGGLGGWRQRRQQRQQLGERRQDETLDEDENIGGAVALPPGASAKRDLAYGDDKQQKLDVYLPAKPEKAPVIVMVHGGAWMFGDKASPGVVENKAAYWLPKGYALVSVNYRMSFHPDPLQEAADVARAVAYVQKHAAAWNADPDRIVLMGHSAGAHLVSLLAADPQIARSAGARPWLGTVSLDSACIDVEQTMNAKHARFYDRVFKSDPADWKAASPMAQLRAAPQPMLMVCSSRRQDSCPQAQAFASKVNSVGGRATSLPEDLSHAEINKTLGAAGDYTESVERFFQSLRLP